MKLILKRLLLALPNLAGVIIVTFIMTRALPGDPAAYFAGAAATPESVAQVRTQLGLDRPMLEQFFSYVSDLAQGDWGVSLATGQPVITEIKARLPASLELTLAGLLLAVSIAIPLGVMAATRPNSLADHAVRAVTTMGVSLPTFFTGLLLIYIFYYKLGWAASPSGRIDAFVVSPPGITGFYLLDSLIAGDWQAFKASAAQLMLPAITLAMFVLAPLARMTRASMLGVLSSDFIRTARASGLTPYTVLYRYALRNALLPVLTTLGMVFSFLLGSNVLVEKVFAWPGIGSFAIESLVASDYAPVQGFVLSMALLYVMLNLCIDLVAAWLDPRIAMEG